jgi:hypothetical protein
LADVHRSHQFVGSDGNVYEWRNRKGEYEVCTLVLGISAYLIEPHQLIAMANGARVAEYTNTVVETPVGNTHAVLHLTFENELLVLETVLALCLARWVNLQNM